MGPLSFALKPITYADSKPIAYQHQYTTTSRVVVHAAVLLLEIWSLVAFGSLAA